MVSKIQASKITISFPELSNKKSPVSKYIKTGLFKKILYPLPILTVSPGSKGRVVFVPNALFHCSRSAILTLYLAAIAAKVSPFWVI
jgi:hypothetical protein